MSALTKNKSKRASRTKKTAKESKPHASLNLRQGRLLSLEFFINHAWLILIAVVVALALIGQRYTNQSKMRQIKKLDHELALLKGEHVATKAAYMSLIRENEMRRLVRSRGLQLDYQEQPPFTLPE